MPWKQHLAYLRYVLRHKYYVFRAALIVGGIPFWRVIIHDWDKFLPDEWRPYVETFYEPDGSKRYKESPAFAAAWNRHQKRNRHHWQYWLLTWDRGETEQLPMPEGDIREMLADWIGTGWAITGRPETHTWYEKNREKIQLHPASRETLEKLLRSVDFLRHLL
jgi:hypothetical protein